MKTLHLTLITAIATLVFIPQAKAESAAELRRQSEKALHRLYDNNPQAEALGERAVAVLVFPKVIQAGFLLPAWYRRLYLGTERLDGGAGIAGHQDLALHPERVGN